MAGNVAVEQETQNLNDIKFRGPQLRKGLIIFDNGQMKKPNTIDKIKLAAELPGLLKEEKRLKAICMDSFKDCKSTKATASDHQDHTLDIARHTQVQNRINEIKRILKL